MSPRAEIAVRALVPRQGRVRSAACLQAGGGSVVPRSAVHPAALFGSLLSLLLVACGDPPPPPIPVMLPLSDFSLTEASGEPFSSDALHGKVWVADLVFTSCPSICPTMTSTMANLHRRITHDDVRFVSISVDPEVDTPEVFDAYATRFSADRARWHFLTGSVEDVNRVIHQSFRLPAGERIDRDDGRYDMLHTGQFILIDQNMNMRGLYETDRAGLDALERDIGRLRNES